MTVDAEGKATRRTVPFSAPESNRVTREVRAQLDRNGKVEFAAAQRMEAGGTVPEERK